MTSGLRVAYLGSRDNARARHSALGDARAAADGLLRYGSNDHMQEMRSNDLRGRRLPAMRRRSQPPSGPPGRRCHHARDRGPVRSCATLFLKSPPLVVKGGDRATCSAVAGFSVKRDRAGNLDVEGYGLAAISARHATP